MSEKLYYVQVLVRRGTEFEWKRVRPTGGDPYVLTEAQAQQFLETHVAASGHPDRYRLEPLPAE